MTATPTLTTLHSPPAANSLAGQARIDLYSRGNSCMDHRVHTKSSRFLKKQHPVKATISSGHKAVEWDYERQNIASFFLFFFVVAQTRHKELIDF